MDVSETVSVNAGIESNNPTSGSIVLSGGGGLGVGGVTGGQIYAGNNLGVTNATNLISSVTIGSTPTEYTLPSSGGDAEYLQQTSTGALLFTDPRSLTSVNYDTVTVTPASGSMVKSLDVGQTAGVAVSEVSTSGAITGIASLSVTGATGASTAGGVLKAGSGTTSSSSISGALVVTGGLGISENINVGGSASDVKGTAAINNVFTTGVSGQQYSFPTAQGTLDQVVTVSTTTGELKFVTPIIDNSDDVIAPNPFGTDNLLIRTTGTDRDVEGTGVVLSDLNDMSGVNSMSVVGESTVGGIVTVNSGAGSAVQVSTGGVGVSGDVNLGGTATFTESVTYSSTVESTSTSTGALVVDGGVGVQGDVNVGGTLNASTIDFDGADLSILSTTESTNTSTGALTIPNGGGVVGGGITVGGSYNLGGGATLGSLNVSDTTESVSSSTGALILSGGMGVSKSIHAGGIILANNTSGTSLSVDGGVGVSGDIYANTTNTDSTTIQGTTILSNGLNSSSPTTGTLVVDGGVGIQNDVYVGGSVFVSGTMVETSKFIHLIHTITVSSSNTTPVPLTWGTTVRKDTSLYTHFPGTSGITIVETGWYDITLDVTSQIETGDGNQRSISSVLLTNGGVAIPNSDGYMYNRTSNRGYGQATVQNLVQLTAGDVIDARFFRLSTSGTGSIITTVANACRILIEKV